MFFGMKRTLRAADLAYASAGAALIAVCAWITVPAAVPFTMQTFAVFLALAALGARRGALAIGLYILLGAAGLPVFSGFGGGPGVLLGPTGGYIWGFLLTAAAYAAVTRLTSAPWGRVLGLLAGLLLCYALGTVWFVIVYARAKGPVSWGTALSWCVLPFIVPDLIKLAMALLVARRAAPALRLRG